MAIVLIMGRGRRTPIAGGGSGVGAALAGAVGLLILGACASGGRGANADPVGDCPGGRIPIVVTVDQWGDLVGRLAGACGDVTTIVSGTTGDPHAYEPTAGDLAAFTGADLVVLNGLGYDAWADKAVDALGHRPAVVDAGVVAGRHDGDNPHLWYDPAAVRAVADAVSEELTALRPRAVEQLRADRTALESDLGPYDAEIAAIKAADGHPRYAATESVFDLMAAALGLEDATPAGYQKAAANGSEAGPADLAAFEDVLSSRSVDVLIYNRQTEGAVPKQLRAAAERAGVPVVEVTETVAPGSTGFVDWQVDQLRRLATALGVR
jgi:zinc/manganese transport system substrate-binding protein